MNKLNTVMTVASISLLVGMLGCTAPTKLVETGDYDEALELAYQRLAGKENKKEEWVRAVEAGFAKANQRDEAEIARLTQYGRAEDWERIYQLYRQIDRRQQRLQPLLPLVSKEGYRAEFDLINTAPGEQEAREQAANFLYTRAEARLADTRRTGDKQLARRAYDDLERIKVYFQTYRQLEVLLREAQELGTTLILVETRNLAPVVLPQGLEQELLGSSFRDLNTDWRVFHGQRQAEVAYDFTIRLVLQELVVSPEQLRERAYVDQKEIEDGFDYVLDERGNVRKDTAGNDIKIPRKVTIAAQVLQVQQLKQAALRGRLELVDGRRGTVIETRPVAAESVFEHFAATFQGDKRALSEVSRKQIGNQPAPFPPDATMLLEAARRLRPQVIDYLRRSAFTS